MAVEARPEGVPADWEKVSPLTSDISRWGGFERWASPDQRSWLSIFLKNGNRKWYQNDVLHRDGGPAVEKADGTKEWYSNGQKIDPPNIDAEHTEHVDIAHGTNVMRKVRDQIQASGAKELPVKALPPVAKNWAFARTPSGNISAELLQNAIDQAPKTKWNVSHAEWDGTQRHTAADSQVFQLNVSQDHINRMKEAGVLGTFKKMQAQIKENGHPVTPYTAGWVRYTKGGNRRNELFQKANQAWKKRVWSQLSQRLDAAEKAARKSGQSDVANALSTFNINLTPDRAATSGLPSVWIDDSLRAHAKKWLDANDPRLSADMQASPPPSAREASLASRAMQILPQEHHLADMSIPDLTAYSRMRDAGDNAMADMAAAEGRGEYPDLPDSFKKQVQFLRERGRSTPEVESMMKDVEAGHHRPRPEDGGPDIFVDEVQSDHAVPWPVSLSRGDAATFDTKEIAPEVLGGTMDPVTAAKAVRELRNEVRDELEQQYPTEHTNKIREILFGGHHPSEVLTDAFLQHQRDIGRVGSKVNIHSVETKGPISLDWSRPLKDVLASKTYSVVGTTRNPGLIDKYPAPSPEDQAQGKALAARFQAATERMGPHDQRVSADHLPFLHWFAKHHPDFDHFDFIHPLTISKEDLGAEHDRVMQAVSDGVSKGQITPEEHETGKKLSAQFQAAQAKMTGPIHRPGGEHQKFIDWSRDYVHSAFPQVKYHVETPKIPVHQLETYEEVPRSKLGMEPRKYGLPEAGGGSTETSTDDELKGKRIWGDQVRKAESIAPEPRHPADEPFDPVNFEPWAANLPTDPATADYSSLARTGDLYHAAIAAAAQGENFYALKYAKNHAQGAREKGVPTDVWSRIGAESMTDQGPVGPGIPKKHWTDDQPSDRSKIVKYIQEGLRKDGSITPQDAADFWRAHAKYLKDEPGASFVDEQYNKRGLSSRTLSTILDQSGGDETVRAAVTAHPAFDAETVPLSTLWQQARNGDRMGAIKTAIEHGLGNEIRHIIAYGDRDDTEANNRLGMGINTPTANALLDEAEPHMGDPHAGSRSQVHKALLQALTFQDMTAGTDAPKPRDLRLVHRVYDAAVKQGVQISNTVLDSLEKVRGLDGEKYVPSDIVGPAMAANFWRRYEEGPRARHFAAVRTHVTGQPTLDFTDHEGFKGSSEEHAATIPFLGVHAKRMQEAALKGDTSKGADSPFAIPKLQFKKIRGKMHVLVHRGLGGEYADRIMKAAGWDPTTNTVADRRVKVSVHSLDSWSPRASSAATFPYMTKKPGAKIVLSTWMPVEDLLHSGYHNAYPEHSHEFPEEHEFIFKHSKPNTIIHSGDISFSGERDQKDERKNSVRSLTKVVVRPKVVKPPKQPKEPKAAKTPKQPKTKPPVDISDPNLVQVPHPDPTAKSEALTKAIDPGYVSWAADSVPHTKYRWDQHLDHHPAAMDDSVKAFRKDVRDEPNVLNPDLTAKQAQGGYSKKVVYRTHEEHAIPPTQQEVDNWGVFARPMFPVKNSYLLKPVATQMDPHQGWAEIASQGLFHAAGIGHLHQKVHTDTIPDENGHDRPVTVVHLHPDLQTLGELGTLEEREAIKRTGRGVSAQQASILKQPKFQADLEKIGLMNELMNDSDTHHNNLGVINHEDPKTAQPLVIDRGRAFQYWRGGENRTHKQTYDRHRIKGANHVAGYSPETLKWWQEVGPSVREEFRRHAQLLNNTGKTWREDTNAQVDPGRVALYAQDTPTRPWVTQQFNNRANRFDQLATVAEDEAKQRAEEEPTDSSVGTDEGTVRSQKA